MKILEPLQAADYQAPLILSDCLGFALLGLVLLFLGAMSRALHSGTDFKSLCTDSRMWGNFIAVFVVVCIPVIWLAASGFRDTGVMAIAAFVPPIFTAGLALEERAERIITEAQQGT